MEKLFLVLRNDLAPGLQIPQAAHAARLFAAEYPKIELEWYSTSNNLAVLQVPDEQALLALYERAELIGAACSGFREPDRRNELTAIALCGHGARRLTASLPLALRDTVYVSNLPPPDLHVRDRLTSA